MALTAGSAAGDRDKLEAVRPLIALTGWPLHAGRVQGWQQPAAGIPASYVQAVRRAGADEALLFPVPLSDDEAAARLERFDALVLIGGGDLDPILYGESPHPEEYGVDAERDAFELALTRAALARRLPVLAICRGLQVLNVALGGSLEQHITDRLPGHGRPGHEAEMHEVELSSGARVTKAMGGGRPLCRSHHHQGLARIGDGLVPVGWSDDGLVEAAEIEDADAWVVGVQWHPEETAAADPQQQGLFDALAEQARN